MENNLPCDWYEEVFQWEAICVWIEDTWQYKYVITPDNDICNACENFKKCCYDLIQEIKWEYEWKWWFEESEETKITLN